LRSDPGCCPKPRVKLGVLGVSAVAPRGRESTHFTRTLSQHIVVSSNESDHWYACHYLSLLSSSSRTHASYRTSRGYAASGTARVRILACRRVRRPRGSPRRSPLIAAGHAALDDLARSGAGMSPPRLGWLTHRGGHLPRQAMLLCLLRQRERRRRSPARRRRCVWRYTHTVRGRCACLCHSLPRLPPRLLAWLCARHAARMPR
jgi:hypothetical protein